MLRDSLRFDSSLRIWRKVAETSEDLPLLDLLTPTMAANFRNPNALCIGKKSGNVYTNLSEEEVVVSASVCWPEVAPFPVFLIYSSFAVEKLGVG